MCGGSTVAVGIKAVGGGADRVACCATAICTDKAGEAVATVVLQGVMLICGGTLSQAGDVGNAPGSVVLVGVQAAGRHAGVGIEASIDGAGLRRARQRNGPAGDLPQGVAADVGQQRLAVESDAADAAFVELVADVVAQRGGDVLQQSACGILVAHGVRGQSGVA